MNKLTIIPVLFALFLISCEMDVLDISPQDRVSEDAVWEDPNLITAYHNELYNAIPHGFYLHMYSKYTDEAYNSAPCCGADIFARNTFDPDNISQVGEGDFWGGYMYYWDRGYEYIRKINVFLEKAEEDLGLENQDRMVAEAHFLRAFTYFELIKRFGGVPIVTQTYQLGDEVEFVRDSFEEGVQFIEDELALAMANLSQSYPSTSSEYGRATVDASQALLSRVLLYAASPLHNPSNDQEKWARAADAAEALLESGYSLYPDYQELFTLSHGDSQNEVIFSRGFTTSNYHETPMHNLNRRFEAYGGWWGSNGPSQNLVDDYEMINGERPFLEDGTVNTTSGYDPQNPYQDRDPRLNASIIYNGGEFRETTFEMWVAEDGESWGFDSYRESGDNPRSHYVLKKFMPTEGPINWETSYTMKWPHFRLAEIYLNYAEAQFELGNEDLARQYLNEVRSREGVNMPDIPATVTGEELRQRIYNERRVELAFENHRFFDIRRWLIADEVENRPIRGMDIFRNMSTGELSYSPVQLLEKIPWEDKMNLLPIASDEIRRNPGIEQNPGW
ncbi:RagB/SusD family nutrient uptake outer membrane protein [Rhodohalobacter sp. SW132]|uniref:RagB/SusD family nutrient uptake outer membrane protein n=1 Tax=Rhodohalobacter sp. SW132 TaxID=2293433 RepID=UPI000E255392|nr:RagB/SusD family nutrient uptake outer membrane protein [Rhodohalobacter sp. SW132]REL38055.1 RagB/SusD family nutrient uptake outer membrane protein [Rhodohalobacter sp. SW132]